MLTYEPILTDARISPEARGPRQLQQADRCHALLSQSADVIGGKSVTRTETINGPNARV